jgi:N-acetylglucosamine-6-sulfatase
MQRTRRLLTAVAFFIVFTANLIAPVSVTAAPTPPNIVVIITDDMRHDQMGDMPTVVSDLIGKGRSFDAGFIVDPICCPSRTSFLRGQYAHTTSVYDIDGPWGGWGQIRTADLEQEMLPVWLDRAGYFTAEVGKYQNGYTALVKPPGWDYWRGKNGGYQNNFKFACIAPDPSCPTTSKWQIYSSTNPGYEAHEVTNRALEAIQRSGSAPFFGWFSYFAPHSPMTPEPKYVDETKQCGDVDYRTMPGFNEPATDTAIVDGVTGLKDKARWLKNKKAWTSDQAFFEGVTQPRDGCRALLSVDDGIAQILAALDAKDPGLDNTVIVFTSDQGVQYGEHSRTQKRVPFEGTIRVPYVVRADGLLGEQATRDASNLVLNIDLAPTLLELAGATESPGCATEEPFRKACLDRGGGFDGKSFASLLTPVVIPTPGFSDRTFLIEMHDDQTFPEYCAVRSPDAKLVRYDKDVGADFEAYDLTGAYGRADPHELHSVVYSGSDGVPKFRAGGQQLFNDLYPALKQLCNPLPPEYLPFPP